MNNKNMAKETFASKLSELKEDLLKKPVNSVVQQVIPVKSEVLPDKKYTQISAYIEDNLLDSFKMKCLKEKTKMSPMIEDLIRNWVLE